MKKILLALLFASQTALASFVVPNNSVTQIKMNQAGMTPKSALNLSLTTSIASHALTIALKDISGNNATATNPINFLFRSSTAATGTYARVSVTGALSVVVPSGGTLGQTSGVNQYVWVYALNDAGTIDLCVSGVSVFDDNTVQTSTAIASPAPTSGTVLYCGSAHTSKPILLIGRILVSEAAAGTWDTAPAEVAIGARPVVNQTDWISFTPTFSAGFGTATAKSGFYKRVGDTLHVRATCTTGTVSGTLVSTTIPLSLSVDTNKLTLNNTNTNAGDLVGRWSAANSGNTGSWAVTAPSSDATVIFSAVSTNTLIPAAGTSAFGSTTITTVTYSVPIVGWSTYGP